jgi:Ca2+-transporting ATPase
MDARGLSSEEASARLSHHGFNELPAAQPKNIWRIVAEVMREPMFLLLIACGTLYMLLGEVGEGAILLSSTLVIIFITFYQYRKTERALDALRSLASPRALVMRDGLEIRIPGRELVPDDVVLLHEGDRVPADALVLDSNHLCVDESLLTGEAMPVEKLPLGKHPDDTQHVYSGTLVVSGRARVCVTHTGTNTRFGSIGKAIESIEQDSTRLQKEMTVLIRRLFIIGGVLSVLVVLAFYFTKGNFIASLLNGLAASMAFLPEEFPVVLTIFLALGAWRLSAQKVLTRKSSAIETLGAATVLCSDKTGTITENKMQVAAIACGEIKNREEFINAKSDSVTELLSTAFLASHPNPVDPMEKAISEAFAALNVKSETESCAHEYPFSNETLAMARVYLHNTLHRVALKGAPEAVFRLCRLPETEMEKITIHMHALAARGFRVLGVGMAEIEISEAFPTALREIPFRFCGLLAFEDPVRSAVPAAVAECHRAGIKVLMITGDFPATATSIGRQINLPNPDQVLSGSQLNELSDEALVAAIAGVHVFARVSPEQKLRIVQALKRRGEIVAMTGDGVNDAPALKAADIGISMGKKGTDVAREASSLVLLDDNFASIVAAIRSGRRIFDNLQKAMAYIISIHIPIIGLVLLPAFWADLPVLLMPLHIVFMELIIDPVCSVAFESEQEERGIMDRAPRSTEQKFFGMQSILTSAARGLLLLVTVMSVYFSTLNEGHSDAEVRAIAFSTLIVGNVFLILSSLSTTRSFFSVMREKNWVVLLFPLSALIMLAIVLGLGFLSELFNMQWPGWGHFLPMILGVVILLLVLEGMKLVGLKKRT